MTPSSAHDAVSALWLQTLQRAMARASHDVKDALNGVSVNLEVIRSRAGRPDTPATALAPFGEAAAQQLERLTTLLEAVLALTRVERAPTDVGMTLRRIVTVCGASSSSSDASVCFRDEGTMGSTLTDVPGDLVRLSLAAPLLDVVTAMNRPARAPEVTCVLKGDQDAVHVTIRAPGRRATMPDAIAAAARAAGVRWGDDEQDLLLSYPRA